MASLFLSYSREDAAKAKLLAKMLERSGHCVWWDRHIQGGSRFASEIDAALKRCDVVIVLWTQSSARSAWVQDEAGFGRDAGRLVPVLLDDCEPPLGFRQFQTIDMSRWKGRGSPPNLPALNDAINARLSREAAAPAAAAAAPERTPPQSRFGNARRLLVAPWSPSRSLPPG